MLATPFENRMIRTHLRSSAIQARLNIRRRASLSSRGVNVCPENNSLLDFGILRDQAAEVPQNVASWRRPSLSRCQFYSDAQVGLAINRKISIPCTRSAASVPSNSRSNSVWSAATLFRAYHCLPLRRREAGPADFRQPCWR